MAGWHHQLDGPEFEQTPGVSDGQGSQACCLWCHKESDTTEQLNYYNHCSTTTTTTTEYMNVKRNQVTNLFSIT